MAVLPAEQVTQRSGIGLVSVTHSRNDNSPMETYWHSTTNQATNDVALTKAVAANQQDRQVVEDRLKAAVPA